VSVPAARLAAQAKVNLALQVGARGGDGYHQLATILARIDLVDDVVVRTLRHREAHSRWRRSRRGQR
jgi:4-diphosphocytidyl-2C-methyl-D-erythritol kinase